MSWTKVDQTDFYALCVIDLELAEEVKEIAMQESKRFREVLRSAIRQRRFRNKAGAGLKKFWAELSPEERTAHAKKTGTLGAAARYARTDKD